MVNELQQLAKEMEDELEVWKKSVEESRDRLYDLNYYTNLQLLTLREQLGKLKDPELSTVDPTALSLLQSVSPNITVPEVRDAVDLVIEDSSGDGREVREHRSTEMSGLLYEQAQELNSDQNAIFSSLVNDYNFPTQLVLQALENCGSIYSEVTNWCATHEVEFMEADVASEELAIEGKFCLFATS